MNNRKIWWPAAILLAMSALTACTSSKSATQSSSTLRPADTTTTVVATNHGVRVDVGNACHWLSDAQLNRTLGTSGTYVRSAMPGGAAGSGCRYLNTRSKAAVSVVGTPTGGKKVYESRKTEFEQFRPTPVTGVGDEAITTVGSLLALQGDKAVFVGVAPPPLHYMPAGTRGVKYVQEQRLRDEKAIAIVLLATV